MCKCRIVPRICYTKQRRSSCSDQGQTRTCTSQQETRCWPTERTNCDELRRFLVPTGTRPRPITRWWVPTLHNEHKWPFPTQSTAVHPVGDGSEAWTRPRTPCTVCAKGTRDPITLTHDRRGRYSTTWGAATPHTSTGRRSGIRSPCRAGMVGGDL